jgi:hypothetical protein
MNKIKIISECLFECSRRFESKQISSKTVQRHITAVTLVNTALKTLICDFGIICGSISLLEDKVICVTNCDFFWLIPRKYSREGFSC